MVWPCVVGVQTHPETLRLLPGFTPTDAHLPRCHGKGSDTPNQQHRTSGDGFSSCALIDLALVSQSDFSLWLAVLLNQHVNKGQLLLIVPDTTQTLRPLKLADGPKIWPSVAVLGLTGSSDSVFSVIQDSHSWTLTLIYSCTRWGRVLWSHWTS